ncbi:response regulator [Magnetovibrio sp. PR-2]|uniref:response regulator n=1 Tax=Magnetovibrio sp. PR-2 TaxID=3120356 RepID=UPI002FCE0941
MVDMNFSKVRLVVSEPSDVIRDELEAALGTHGFHSMLSTSRHGAIEEALGATDVDCIICGHTTNPQDTQAFIQDIRHQRIGTNPVVVVFTLISDPQPQSIRQLVDSGCDSILVKEGAVETLVKRLKQITLQRKPFVVTSEYIGPDRRDNQRSFGEIVPLLKVPNPMYLRAIADEDSETIKTKIASVSQDINLHKIARHIVQISWLTEHLVQTNQLNDTHTEIEDYLERLHTVIEDLYARALHTCSPNVLEPCTHFGDFVFSISNNTPDRRSRHIEKLPQLAAGVRKVFRSHNTALHTFA